MSEFRTTADVGHGEGDGEDGEGTDGDGKTGGDGATAELAALRESHEALKRLYRTSSDPSLSTEERIERMLRIGRERLGVPNGYLARIDAEAGDYEVVQAEGPGVVAAGMESDLAETYCDRIVASGETAVVADVLGTDWADAPAYERFGLRCYVGSEVRVDGELYGTVCFSGTEPRDPFTEDERTLVELLVEWIGNELERNRYERERRLRTEAIERAGSAITIAENEAGGEPLSYANRGFEELTGYDREEVVGESCTLLQGEGTDPDTRTGFRRALDAGEPFETEVLNYRKDGTPFWNEVQVSPVREGGEVVRFVGTQRDVTDRVERRKRLRRYERVVETGRDMVAVVGPDGEVRLATSALASFLGYDRRRLEGRTVDGLVPDEVVERIRDDLGRLDGHESPAYETTVETADGSRRAVEIRPSWTGPEDELDGVVVVVRDIAELQRTRADLAAERERFTYLFENLADPVVEVEFVDGEPLVSAQNEAFLRTFGVEPEETVGRHVYETVTVANASDAGPDELVDRIRDGEAVSARFRAHTVEGVRDFRFRAVPYEADGPRAFGILVDVTEERRRQRRLKVLNRVLRHNVRNQLTVAMGSAGLLAEADDVDPADAARLRGALAEIASLSEKTRELERLLAETDARPGDPRPVVREVVTDRRETHPDATIEYDGTPEAVETPAVGQLRPVLDELLENAVVHGGNEPWVRVSVETADDGGVAVVVEDDGPGIPESERAVVAGEVQITQLSHATGLGLWTVEMVVDAMGGAVRFGATEEGSQVAVELPPAE